MYNLAVRHRTIDEILTATEDKLRQTITPEEFKKNIQLDMLYFAGNVHVSKSIAKTKGTEWPLHIHKDRCETIILVEGKGLVTIGDRYFTLLPGSSIAIPENTMHGGVSLADNTEFISVVVPADENTAKLIGLIESTKWGRQ